MHTHTHAALALPSSVYRSVVCTTHVHAHIQKHPQTDRAQVLEVLCDYAMLLFRSSAPQFAITTEEHVA